MPTEIPTLADYRLLETRLKSLEQKLNKLIEGHLKLKARVVKLENKNIPSFNLPNT